MEKRYKRIAAVFLVLLLLSLTACGRTVNDWDAMWDAAAKLGAQADPMEIHELTDEMIQVIRSNDPEQAFELLIPGGDWNAFLPAFQELHSMVADIEVYTMMMSNVHTQKNLGTDDMVTSVQYLLSGGKDTLGETRLIVNVVYSSQHPGRLASFYLAPYVEVTQTGTLTSMKGAGAAQWILLIVGLAEIGFMIWMFIDCCRHKLQKKWLWLLLTAMGIIAFTVSADNGGVRLNFNIGFFFNLYTSLALYSNGAMQLRLMIPVGAIAYAVIRKQLFADYEKAQLPQPAVFPEGQLPNVPEVPQPEAPQPDAPQPEAPQPETPQPEEPLPAQTED